jgi:hypothetical protein
MRNFGARNGWLANEARLLDAAAGLLSSRYAPPSLVYYLAAHELRRPPRFLSTVCLPAKTGRFEGAPDRRWSITEARNDTERARKAPKSDHRGFISPDRVEKKGTVRFVRQQSVAQLAAEEMRTA